MSPSNPTSATGDLTPLSGRDRSYHELEERLSSLAANVSHWQRDLEEAAGRASRLEGAFSVLISSLEGFKSDLREVASRTEMRVLRGLELIDSRITHVRPQVDTSGLTGQIEQLAAGLAARLDRLSNRLDDMEHKVSAPAPADDTLPTRVLEGLEAVLRRLQALEDRAARPPAEVQLPASLSEGFSAVGNRLEAVLRQLKALEERPAPPPGEVQLPASIGESFVALGSRVEAVLRQLQALEERSSVSPGEIQVPVALTDGLAALDKRLEALERRGPATDPQLLTRVAEGFDTISRRVDALAQRPVPAPDDAPAGRVLEGLQAVVRRLQALEEKPVAQVGEVQLPASLTEGLLALGSRLEALERKGPATDPQLLGRVAEGFDSIGRRVDALVQRAAPAENLPTRVTEGFDALTQRLSSLDQKIAAQDAETGSRMLDGQRDLERRIAESNANLERRIAETQQAFLAGVEALRSLVAQRDPAENRHFEQVTSSIKALETRLSDSQEALTRKLDSVQAESDENNATQLRYLAGLEELQSTVAKRVQSLESLVQNPLDAQQWERLARGLEFLDSRLAQSYDSVANRLDTAIAALTATLDNRAASSQEVNLKSAERLWRALRGLEDQITTSYQMVNQSQERLESAAQNLAASIEDLGAVAGARAGHTEKLVMEGLENLDGRFAQNLMTVSESLGTALFALNKATGEWRAELANANEESEERVAGHISQVESKLAGDLKAGLDAIGRREERMLALILGGGPSLTPPTPVREVGIDLSRGGKSKPKGSPES